MRVTDFFRRGAARLLEGGPPGLSLPSKHHNEEGRERKRGNWRFSVLLHIPSHHLSVYIVEINLQNRFFPGTSIFLYPFLLYLLPPYLKYVVLDTILYMGDGIM